MTKRTIIIDGKNFIDRESFFEETDKVLTKDLGWQTGHNPDAFNDLLCGGFGVFGYDEPIKLIWINFAKSRNDLGQELTDTLVEIITGHDHIEFTIID